jgi:hypothetical protein
MTDSDDPKHRAYHQPDPDRVELRQADDEDGVFRVRMPIATTGDVRNQGDEPLTREELEGMAEQIESRRPSVFADHGRNPTISGSRYSVLEVNGTWEGPEVRGREVDDEAELVADARLMDPDTMPEETGMLREALARVKAQAERDIPLRSSIGWDDNESAPGGVDLMEASLVGIPADPRTTSGDAELAQARGVVMGPGDHNRHLSEQQAEIAARMIDAYREAQGNGSVENFEDWLFSVAYYDFDENEFHAAMTALQEFYRETTPLEEPVTEQFVPFLSGEVDDGGNSNTNDMTESESDQSGDGDGTEPDGEQDGSDGIGAEEFREQMLEMQRQQTETLNALSESISEQDADGDGSDAESGGGEEDGEETQDADGPEQTQTVEVDGEELDIDELVEDYERSRQALQQGDVDLDDIDLGEQSLGEEADSGEDTGDAGADEQRDNQENTTSAGWLS